MSTQARASRILRSRAGGEEDERLRGRSQYFKYGRYIYDGVGIVQGREGY